MIRKLDNKYRVFFVVADILFVSLAFVVTSFIRFNHIYFFPTQLFNINLLLIIIIYVFFMYIFDMYEVNLSQTNERIVLNLTVAFIVVGIMLSFLYYIFPEIRVGRGLWFIQLSLSYCLLLSMRLIAQYYLKVRYHKKRIIIIGRNQKTIELIKAIKSSSYCKYIGTISENKKKKEFDKYFTIIGSLSEIELIFKKNNIDGIIITDKSKLNKKIEKIILNARMKGILVYDMPTIIELLEQKVLVREINDFWIIYHSFRGVNLNIYNKKIKRINDVIFSIIGLITALPIILLTFILIKLESRGPAFYKQIRVGKNNKNFKIIKFRSMINNAEKNGAVWAKKKDTRVTRVGKVIRKIRIDEIPQLWNVLKGDMTLIGPRPERPEFVDKLNKDIPYFSMRHLVKPGISGWAQIKYPYAASIEDATEKLQYDLFYIRHLTFKLDLVIILRTIKTVLFGLGAR